MLRRHRALFAGASNAGFVWRRDARSMVAATAPNSLLAQEPCFHRQGSYSAFLPFAHSSRDMYHSASSPIISIRPRTTTVQRRPPTYPRKMMSKARSQGARAELMPATPPVHLNNLNKKPASTKDQSIVQAERNPTALKQQGDILQMQLLQRFTQESILYQEEVNLSFVEDMKEHIALAKAERKGDAYSLYAEYLAARKLMTRVYHVFRSIEDAQSNMMAEISICITDLESLVERIEGKREGASSVSEDCSRIRKDVKKRRACLESLEQDFAMYLRDKRFQSHLAHVYRFLVNHQTAQTLHMDEVTFAVSIQKLAFDTKSMNVCFGAKELVMELTRLFENLPRDGTAAALRNRVKYFCTMAYSHLHFTSRLAREVSDCSNALQALTLENHGRGRNYTRVFLLLKGFYNLLRPFDRNRVWATTRSPLFPARTRYPELVANTLASIDKRVKMIFIVALGDLNILFKGLRESLWAKARELDTSGQPSLSTTHLNKRFVDAKLEDYKVFWKSPRFVMLRRWGYKPSKWLRRLCESSPQSRVRPRAFVQVSKTYVSPMQSHHRTNFKMRRYKIQKYLSTGRPPTPPKPRHRIRAQWKNALSSLRRTLVSTLLSFDQKVPAIQVPKRTITARAGRKGLSSSGLSSTQVLSSIRKDERKIPNLSDTSQHKDQRTDLKGHSKNAPMYPKKVIKPVPKVITSPTEFKELPLLSKDTTLGKTFAILGLDNAQSPKNGKLTTVESSAHRALKLHTGQPAQRQLPRQPKWTTGKEGKTHGAHWYIDTSHAFKRRANESTGPSVRFFKPSQRMSAQHSTSFFTENTTSNENNNVNGNVEGKGAADTGNDNKSSNTQDSKGDYDPGSPDNGTSNSAQNTISSTQDMPDTQSQENSSGSDSEQESDIESEHDVESDSEDALEEHIPLSFQIPADVLKAALQAPPNTRASYWSQKLYQGPNGESLSIHYCRTMEIAERVAKYFLEERVVGFDIEWKPVGARTPKENVALIQLACEDRIALFHISLFPGRTPEQFVPKALRAVLESPNIYKVGVSVKSDFTRVRTHLDIQARGVFELSRLHNLVEYYETDPSKVNFKLFALSKQVQQYLLLPLHKGEPLADDPVLDPSNPNYYKGSVRESDWSQRLDHEQIHYAAADAYAGFRLFDVLEEKRKKLKPTPPLPRLCDFDALPAQKTASKPKAVKKPKDDPQKVVAKALSGLAADDSEEQDTQEYETAPEELADGEEAEEPESESESETSSEESEDSDADYVPQRLGRISLEDSGDSRASPRTNTRRVGRVDFGRLADGNPSYPTLPDLSSDEGEGVVDLQDTAESTTGHQVQNDTGTDHGAEEATPEVTMEAAEDEYADPELEDSMMAMDIDEKPSETVERVQTEEEPDTGHYPPIAGQKPENNVDITHPDDAHSTLSQAPTSFIPLSPDTTLHTPEYTLATSWAHTYLHSTVPPPSSSLSSRPSSIRATTPHLRAYHLWHHQQLPLHAIGPHLRDPPLAQSTVANYILQAVALERLEYREAELREVLIGLPAGLRMGRWRGLCRRVGVGR